MPSRRTVLEGLGLAALVPGFARAATSRRRQVLGFYYRSYASPAYSGAWKRWTGNSGLEAVGQGFLDHPTLGWYDARDPAVVAQHAEWAQRAGLTGLISGNWTRAAWADRAAGLQLLDALGARGLTLSIYLEGQKNGVDGALDDFRYLLANGVAHSAWLRVDGRPVFFLYRRALRDLPAAGWREAARRMAADGNPEPLLIADIEPDDPDYAVKAAPMDGVHQFSLEHYLNGMTPERALAWANAIYPAWQARAAGKLYCATVSPGWDDTRQNRKPVPRATFERFGTKMLKALWTGAISARPDWVLVSTFNAWDDSSEIEPSIEHGERPLDVNAAFARRFLAA